MSEASEPLAVALTSLSHGAGCGCKLSAADIGPIVAALPAFDDPRLLVGSATSDDAGIVQVRDDLALVQSVDFFTPIVDDPYDFGRIAAANALSDIYAMGGEPLCALNLVAFPLETLGGAVLGEILRGGADVVRAAGALLVGGHSIDDPEPKYGLAVTGLVDPRQVVSNAGGRAGDLLVLTKPLGVGAISTALKRGRGAELLGPAVETMTTLNAEASRAALAAGAHAMTDVTGFGLLGHLRELADASGLAAEVDAAAVPALDGVEALLRDGDAVSGGSRRNRAHAETFARFADDVEEWQRSLVCDATTSGGLLVAVAAERAGDVPGAVVGRLVEGRPGSISVTRGAARAWWPDRPSKPGSRGSPAVGRFDSFAAPSPSPAARLRALPSVDRLATAVARAELADRRADLQAGADDDVDLVAGARARLRPTPRRVLNATGVILHTNLGRAPLAAAARQAVAGAAGYCDVELDLASGERGSRHDHVERLLCELTGAEAAMVVNNCAGATLLAVAATAGPGREVVVSRGQLVEIGGGFRIPEVVAQAGARLVEVGTTNRTRVADYRSALGPETGAILRVHQSNFRTVGFVEDVPIEELCSLGPPVVDDVGSGVLDRGSPLLEDEPTVRRSAAAGAALVTCSGDKLLGGPQAGMLVGRSAAIAACRAHPLARALRIDKLSLAALAATLQLHRDPELARRELPVLAMLDVDEAVLAERARRLASGTGGEVVDAVARVGGGALPLLELRGPAVALAGDPQVLAAALRAQDPPLVGRAHRDTLLLDPRTLTDAEVDLAVAAVRAARS